MTRKPVVLVTGAGGEIGHGLIHRLAELRHLRHPGPRRPGRWIPSVARRCAAAGSGDILDRHLLDRLRSEFEISVVFHLAALLSTRAEFVARDGPRGQRGGHAEPPASGRRRGALARPPGEVPLPELDRGLRPAGPRTPSARRARSPRTPGSCADHDVRLQQALLRAPRPLLRRVTTASSRRRAEPSGVDFRAIRFPGLISAVTTAERRHQRLRAGDAPRRRPGPALRLLRARGHAHPVHGDARRDHRAARAAGRARPESLTGSGLQRGGLQPERRRARRAACARRSPGARITFAPDARRQAIVDSWPEDVDDAPRPPRLGLPARLRPDRDVRRVPACPTSRAATRTCGRVSGTRAREATMYGDVRQRLQAELDEIRDAGLWKDERVLERPQGARVTVSRSRGAELLRQQLPRAGRATPR